MDSSGSRSTDMVFRQLKSAGNIRLFVVGFSLYAYMSEYHCLFQHSATQANASAAYSVYKRQWFFYALFW